MVEFLEEALALWGQRQTIRLVRADSGFFDDKLLSFLEQRCLPYIVVTRLTKWVQREAQRIQHWTELDANYAVGEFRLQLHGWSTERQFVVIRERIRDNHASLGRKRIEVPGYTFRIFVTSLADPPEQIWRDYNRRADIENRIAELKHDLNADHFCLKQFHATEAAFRSALLLFNLLSRVPTRRRHARLSRTGHHPHSSPHLWSDSGTRGTPPRAAHGPELGRPENEETPPEQHIGVASPNFAEVGFALALLTGTSPTSGSTGQSQLSSAEVNFGIQAGYERQEPLAQELGDGKFLAKCPPPPASHDRPPPGTVGERTTPVGLTSRPAPYPAPLQAGHAAPDPPRHTPCRFFLLAEPATPQPLAPPPRPSPTSARRSRPYNPRPVGPWRTSIRSYTPNANPPGWYPGSPEGGYPFLQIQLIHSFQMP